MSRVIRHASLRPVTWRNGGGSTTELAVAPEGASYADFDWRISLATIAQDGPFSSFPGVDRSLALVEGRGVDLEIDGTRITLDERAPPVAFRGESMVQARLIGGGSTDFNVMTRRARVRHRLRRIALRGRGELAPGGALRFVLLASGARLRLRSDETELELGPLDAALIDDGERWTLDSDEASLLVAEFDGV